MMYDYNDDITPPSIFHVIFKKKAWLWNPSMLNDGRDVWEYKYMKPDYPKPAKMFDTLP